MIDYRGRPIDISDEFSPLTDTSDEEDDGDSSAAAMIGGVDVKKGSSLSEYKDADEDDVHERSRVSGTRMPTIDNRPVGGVVPVRVQYGSDRATARENRGPYQKKRAASSHSSSAVQRLQEQRRKVRALS